MAVAGKLAAFDAPIARHEQPALPYFREANAERPPTRIWDGLVATGASRALAPQLLYKLALFYTRQESNGERYVRYNDFTESRVFAMGPDQSEAWMRPVACDPNMRPGFIACAIFGRSTRT